MLVLLMIECTAKISLCKKYSDNFKPDLIQQNGTIYRWSDFNKEPTNQQTVWQVHFLKKVEKDMYLFCKALAHLLMLENITWCSKCNPKIWNKNSQKQIPVTYSPSFLQHDSASPIILIYVFEQTKHWFHTQTNHNHVARRVSCMNVTLLITIYRTRRNQVFQYVARNKL